jgi:hypothetical protein
MAGPRATTASIRRDFRPVSTTCAHFGSVRGLREFADRGAEVGLATQGDGSGATVRQSTESLATFSLPGNQSDFRFRVDDCFAIRHSIVQLSLARCEVEFSGEY